MMDSVHITNNFEGSNPFKEDWIIRTRNNSYTVFPFCEDATNNYKFRLDIKFINHDEKQQKVDLVIDWKDREFNCYRDTLYMKNEKSSWETKTGILKDGKTLATFGLMPGETYVALSPKYNLSDLLAFLTKLPRDVPLQQKIIGTTAKGRKIWLVCSTIPHKKNRKKLLFSARVHPYETAPSYIIEGLLSFLSGPDAGYFIQAYDIYILPMMCPDGVSDGCCRLSALKNGVDLSREIQMNHDLTRMYLTFLQEIQPDIYIELHNWMLKDVDGIFYLNILQAVKLTRALRFLMPKDLQKKWEVGCRHRIFAKDPRGLKRYCKSHYDTTVLTLEFPWHERDVEDMRAIGSYLLPAIDELT